MGNFGRIANSATEMDMIQRVTEARYAAVFANLSPAAIARIYARTKSRPENKTRRAIRRGIEGAAWNALHAPK